MGLGQGQLFSLQSSSFSVILNQLQHRGSLIIYLSSRHFKVVLLFLHAYSLHNELEKIQALSVTETSVV